MNDPAMPFLKSIDLIVCDMPGAVAFFREVAGLAVRQEFERFAGLEGNATKLLRFSHQFHPLAQTLKAQPGKSLSGLVIERPGFQLDPVKALAAGFLGQCRQQPAGDASAARFGTNREMDDIAHAQGRTEKRLRQIVELRVEIPARLAIIGQQPERSRILNPALENLGRFPGGRIREEKIGPRPGVQVLHVPVQGDEAVDIADRGAPDSHRPASANTRDPAASPHGRSVASNGRPPSRYTIRRAGGMGAKLRGRSSLVFKPNRPALVAPDAVHSSKINRTA